MSPQSAPYWIPLIVLIIGFVLTGLARMVGRYNERNNVRKLTINNITNLFPRVAVLKRALQDIVNSFNFQEDTVMGQIVPFVYQLQVFEEMKYEEIFKAYFTGIENYFFWSSQSSSEQEKLTKFNRLWEIINGLNIIVEMINSKRDSFEEINNKKRDQYNDSLTALRLAWSEYLRQNRFVNDLSPNQRKFRDSLVNVLNTFQEVPAGIRTMPFNTYQKLVVPILDITAVDGNDTDQTISPFIEAGLQAHYNYINLQAFLNSYIGQINMWIDAMSKMEVDLKDILMNFRK